MPGSAEPSGITVANASLGGKDKVATLMPSTAENLSVPTVIGLGVIILMVTTICRLSPNLNKVTPILKRLVYQSGN